MTNFKKIYLSESGQIIAESETLTTQQIAINSATLKNHIEARKAALDAFVKRATDELANYEEALKKVSLLEAERESNSVKK